ncbi:MAG: hypothetical protein K5872_15345 [Rhizobiaceae bacterium]|nr:hypothetical protein [Rhizobiaceae bacterium]MCV0407597.1 hypothetical protein [Rhizobiaceae bacterium]
MRIAIAIIAAAAALSSATLAAADPRYRDQVHADSFGNLVIYAPGGYKRIVVDKGYLAEELATYGLPAAAHGESTRPSVVYRKPCRLPASVRGRSFMYGLPEGVVPIISRPCE